MTTAVAVGLAMFTSADAAFLLGAILITNLLGALAGLLVTLVGGLPTDGSPHHLEEEPAETEMPADAARSNCSAARNPEKLDF